ncbi:class I SAM-dependent methyltransferase [Acidomonas methanolica]|uniref:class I SAM-dependent methyltransferase n=1 Tax=Acidomonas methanolica TaxID=437 RepID=UPI002119E1EB|nr:class I SAM-dependent methyltransferase [Acidomonas methanolica]MCQ9155046.1 methyltransferase domain-containing protein [Acidomonas methanolica]
MSDTSPDGLQGFHPRAFARANEEPDALFYARTADFSHMDAGAQAAVTALYQTALPASGAVCDLMCGTTSHFPPGVSHAAVTGIDVSLRAMEANPALTERVVQDLNVNPALPFPDDSLDAVTLCDGLAYLTRPVEVLREVARVLRPGAPLLLSFSDNVHSAKAVALWQALDPADRVRLTSVLLARAGFGDMDSGDVVPPEDLPAWTDAVHAIIARKPLQA